MGNEMGGGGFLRVKAVLMARMTFLPGVVIADGLGGSTWVQGGLSGRLRKWPEGSIVRPIKKQSIVNTWLLV
jgi:hypothetical protein